MSLYLNLENDTLGIKYKKSYTHRYNIKLLKELGDYKNVLHFGDLLTYEFSTSTIKINKSLKAHMKHD